MSLMSDNCLDNYTCARLHQPGVDPTGSMRNTRTIAGYITTLQCLKQATKTTLFEIFPPSRGVERYAFGGFFFGFVYFYDYFFPLFLLKCRLLVLY